MKMQKCAIFVEKRLKINILMTENNVKLETIVTLQVNTEVLYIVYVI